MCRVGVPQVVEPDAGKIVALVILLADSPKIPERFTGFGRQARQFSMSFTRLYARVLGLLAAQKWLAAALVLANVALAVSQFAEPLLFGKVIDQLSHAQGSGAPLQWSGIGPSLAAWVAFGIFSIVASVAVALHSDRLAHRHRVAVMAAFFEHVLHLPMSFHSSAHTGRLLKVMIEGCSTKQRLKPWKWLTRPLRHSMN